MIGQLSGTEIEDVLRRGRVGHIACSHDNRPYLVPITYVYDDGAVYALSTLGRKIEIMRHQPRVCFEVEEIEQPSTWRCVIADAEYEELPHGPTRTRAIHLVADIGGPLSAASLQTATSDTLVVFRLRLTHTSGRFARHPA